MAYGKSNRLHTNEDLLDGYRKGDPLAFIESRGFKAYRQYIADGAAAPASIDIRLAQAEHDARIADASACVGLLTVSYALNDSEAS